MVKKVDVIEPFSRDKLFLSVYESCKHRKDALGDSQALTATIITKLLPHVQDASLPNREVIVVTTKVLKRFDKAAHAHYQAFHPAK